MTTAVAPAREAATNSRQPHTLDIDAVEQLAADGKSKTAAAEELGMNVKTFMNHFNPNRAETSVRDAWHRGTASRDPNAEEKIYGGRTVTYTAAKIEELAEQYGSIRRVSKELEQKVDDVTYIKFNDGSLLWLAFEGNILKLSPADRDFLSFMSRSFQQYPDGIKMYYPGIDRPEEINVSFGRPKLEERPSRWQRFKAFFAG